MTDMLVEITDCSKSRAAGIHDRCKAKYEGLA